MNNFWCVCERYNFMCIWKKNSKERKIYNSTGCHYQYLYCILCKILENHISFMWDEILKFDVIFINCQGEVQVSYTRFFFIWLMTRNPKMMGKEAWKGEIYFKRCVSKNKVSIFSSMNKKSSEWYCNWILTVLIKELGTNIQRNSL